jgi:hypothetical protein
MKEYTVIAVITEYMNIVKYPEGDNLYGLMFCAGSPTAQNIQYEAKNNDDAVFKGAMLAKEKGFF